MADFDKVRVAPGVRFGEPGAVTPLPPAQGQSLSMPPTIDFNLTHPAEGGREIHISVPVMPYAQDGEGFIRPAYIYDLCQGLAEIFGETAIVRTQVHSALEHMMREGAHGTVRGTVPGNDDGIRS